MAEIVTPLTQALAEGKLTREDLRELMARADAPAFRHLAIWVLVVCATGSLIALAWDSWLIWPAMFLHGIVVVHHFALQHECVHSTVFRTRWLTKVAGTICGLIIMLPFKQFRYEHCDHHTHTQIEGADPEIVPTPQSLAGYLWYLSAIPYWRNNFAMIGRHVRGHLTPEEKRFIPEVERAAVFFEARAMVAVYAAVLALMAATGWWAPVWFWLIPLFLGEPVMRFIRMTEHVGRPMVAQMHENTRTNLVSLPWRFLAWNMNYHAEHHYAASVPYHALPRLHEKLKDHVHVEPGGYVGAHRDILRQLFGTARGA